MIFSACSRRKKANPDPALHPRELPVGTVQAVATRWHDLVEAARKPFLATSLYGGRAFTDAAWSARATGCSHYIISAGLGLIAPEQPIPAYALTTAGATDENVLYRCPVGAQPVDWWRNAFAGNQIAQAMSAAPGRIYLAMPKTYVEMILEDLMALDPETTAKLRIFTGAGETLRNTVLARNVLPYDARLDGPDSPLPGTKSDFASRALRHFVVLTQNEPYLDLDGDTALVKRALEPMRLPDLPIRQRASDETIRAALVRSWASANGNRQKLLRHLRDDLLISCEQSRFARIARELQNEGSV